MEGGDEVYECGGGVSEGGGVDVRVELHLVDGWTLGWVFNEAGGCYVS